MTCRFDNDLPCEAPAACEFMEFPDWLAPYWCVRVSPRQRAVRQVVFAEVLDDWKDDR